MALGKMKWWEALIPGWNTFRLFYDVCRAANDFSGQLEQGYSNKASGDALIGSSANGLVDASQEVINNHGLDDSGNIDITPADPTSSAANVIDHDPNKSAQENLLGYAKANNSASAYSQYLANQYATEMSNTALSRAIADAEANGISKYQLFQSGNMAASTPSSGSSTYQSYENAMNRRESWNEKELDAIVKIITTTISSALGVLGK